MARARVRVSESLDRLLRSDWEIVISQAALGEEDTKIATRYLLDAIPQVEIGAEIGITRSAVAKRLPKIIDKIERAATKLNMI